MEFHSGKKGRNCTLQLHDCTSATDKKFGTTIFSIHGVHSVATPFLVKCRVFSQFVSPNIPATSLPVRICIHCLTLGLLFRPLFAAAIGEFFSFRWLKWTKNSRHSSFLFFFSLKINRHLKILFRV